MSREPVMISVDDLQKIMEHHSLRLDKTKNTRMNVGMRPEYLVVQGINKLLKERAQ